MHFQVIKDEYYNSLLKDLKRKVPEFQSVFDDEDGVYPVLGDFGNFLVENINKREITSKAFQFINHAIEKGGTETEDAIIIQIFHQFYDNDLLVPKVEFHLTEKSLKVFRQALDEYENNDPCCL